MLWELQAFRDRGDVAIKRNQPLTTTRELSVQGCDEKPPSTSNTGFAPRRPENTFDL